MKKSEIKKLIKEILAETMEEGSFADASGKSPEWRLGYSTARKDAYQEIERPLNHPSYSEDFREGYKQYAKDTRWQRWQEKLTNLTSETGFIFRKR
jgi:hypothetical protein